MAWWWSGLCYDLKGAKNTELICVESNVYVLFVFLLCNDENVSKTFRHITGLSFSLLFFSFLRDRKTPFNSPPTVYIYVQTADDSNSNVATTDNKNTHREREKERARRVKSTTFIFGRVCIYAANT